MDELLNPVKPITIGLTDADSMIYLVSWRLSAVGYPLPKEDGLVAIPDIIYAYVNELYAAIKEQAGVDKLQLHFTASQRNKSLYEELTGKQLRPQFRTMLAEYKSARPVENVFYYLTILRAITEVYETYLHDFWEADDAVVLLSKTMPNSVVISNDKDVYNQSVGKSYQYDKRKSMKETNASKANMFPYLQTITGDPVDGFFGAKGIGAKGAANFINESMSPFEMWEGCVRAFESVGMTEKQALVNMRMASMHQLQADQTIQLFEPPTRDQAHVYLTT